MSSNGSVPTTMADHLRLTERRLSRQERRQSATDPGDLLGPGLAAEAVQIMDWNNPDTTVNGFFYSMPGASNSPNGSVSWTGQTVAKDDGTGMQQVWNTDGATAAYWVRTYATVFPTIAPKVIPLGTPTGSTVPSTASRTGGSGSISDGNLTTGVWAETLNDPTSENDEYGFLTCSIPEGALMNPSVEVAVGLSGPDPEADTFLIGVVDSSDGEVVETIEVDASSLTAGTPQTVLRATNLHTNPSFETSSGISTLVETNLCTNPSFETNATGWSGGTTRVNTRAQVGAWSGLLPVGGNANFSVTAAATTTYNCSAWVWVPAAMTGTVTPRIGGASVTPANGPTITARDQWVRVSQTITTNATGGAMVFYPCFGGAVAQAFVDGVMMHSASGSSASFPLPYFDGDTAAADEFVYAWTGTAHASTSTRRIATGVAGVPGAGGAGVTGWSTDWADTGTHSLRSISKYHAAGSGYVDLGHLVDWGKTYTVGVKCRLRETATSTPLLTAFTLSNGGSDLAAVTNVTSALTPGVYDLRITFTLPANLGGTKYLRIVNANLNGFSVWWDSCYIVEQANYTGGYHSGATADTAQWDYAWTGAADASTSTKSEIVPLYQGVVPFEALRFWTDGTYQLRFSRGDFVDTSEEGTSVAGVYRLDLFEAQLQDEVPYQGTANPAFSDWKKFATPSGYVGEGEIDPPVMDTIVNAAEQAAQALADAEEALEAATTASGNRVFRQGTAPVSDGSYTLRLGDTWFNTADGNRIMVWYGSPTPTWTDSQDALIAAASADAAAAEAAAAAAVADAADAIVAAGEAQTTADGKNKVTYSTAAPGATPNTAGDIWFRRDGSGVIYQQYEGMGGTTWTQRTISHLSATAIDGMTITGATVQTEATAARGVKMTSGGIVGYNTTGDPVFTLGTDGALTLRGSITSGSLITGAVFQTEATVARGIKIFSTALIGYNNSGVATTTIDTITGTITTTGSVLAGGTIDGAVVTGGTLQTESTLSRGVKINSSGMVAYNAVGDPTFTVVAATGDVAMKGTLQAGSTITADALITNNVLAPAITGTDMTATTITGATIQTRSASERGIKLGVIGGVEGLFIYDDTGVPFLKAVPSEGMAVIAGEVKASTLTVTGGSSLGGDTDITRNADGTAGVLRLTAYTQKPKSAPVVTTTYDVQQFTNDGQWGNRLGWTTDGTYWYTLRSLPSGNTAFIERWTNAGTFDTQVQITKTVPTSDDIELGGVAINPSTGKLYALFGQANFGNWWVERHTLSSLAYEAWNTWDQYDEDVTGSGHRLPAIGYDVAADNILIAQSRPSSTPKLRVRITRYTMGAQGTSMPAGVVVNSDDPFDQSLASVLYGTFDFGANRFMWVTRGGATGVFNVISTGGVEQVNETFPCGSTNRVGFTFTGGVFKSMDKSGVMRTYTALQATDAGSSSTHTKWVSTTFANATLETDQSPRAKIVMPKRSKLLVVASAINTGGSNAPDRVRIYVGQGSIDPTRTGMWKQTDPAVGVTSTSYSTLSTSGTNPPATNGFAASGGTVQRFEQGDGTLIRDAVGKSELLQSGTVASGTLTADTNKDVAVTFTTAFKVAPKVVVGTVDLNAAHTAFVCAVTVTTSGFSARFRRVGGTGAIDANWIAMPSN